MATIGGLGNITFSVSKKAIKTFNNLKWDSSVSFASHDRHLLTPKKEFTGINDDTISFDMYFSVFLGLDPLAEINKLLAAERSGEAMRLVLGNKIYGKRWVILKTSKALERFDKKGRLLVAKVNVSIESYH